MKIIAAATALNIVKDERRRYNKIVKIVNEIIVNAAESGEKRTIVNITNLTSKMADKVIKELKDAGYVIKEIKYGPPSLTGKRSVFITINWAGV